MDNIRVGLIGDLHFTPSNFKELGECLNHVVNLMIEQNVRLVVQLGDIFDFYNISSGQTSVATIVEAARRPLWKLADHKIDVVIIEGNHDKSTKGHQGDFHHSSIELLAYSTTKDDGITYGVYPITKADVFRVPSLKDAPFALQCLPWQFEDERPALDEMAKHFKKLTKNDFSLWVAHCLMEGATHHGREITQGEFMVSDKQLKAFGAKAAAAGHIHHRQGIYAGIIYQNNLNDAGAPTGVRIIDCDLTEKKVTEDRFVEVKSPQWRLIETDNPDPENIKKIISEINTYDKYVIRVFGKRISNVPYPANVRGIEYRSTAAPVSRITIDQTEAQKMTLVDWFVTWAKTQVDSNTGEQKYSQAQIDKAVEFLVKEGIK